MPSEENPPHVAAMCAEIDRLTTEAVGLHRIVELRDMEIKNLRGAIEADRRRLTDAAARAGIPPWGCDTADALVEKIKLLAARNVKLEHLRTEVADLCSGQINWDGVRAALAACDQPPDPGVDLHRTMDATVWADEFCKRTQMDRGFAISWFANAIMTGFDHAACDQPEVTT